MPPSTPHLLSLLSLPALPPPHGLLPIFMWKEALPVQAWHFYLLLPSQPPHTPTTTSCCSLGGVCFVLGALAVHLDMEKTGHAFEQTAWGRWDRVRLGPFWDRQWSSSVRPRLCTPQPYLPPALPVWLLRQHSPNSPPSIYTYLPTTSSVAFLCLPSPALSACPVYFCPLSIPSAA